MAPLVRNIFTQMAITMTTMTSSGFVGMPRRPLLAFGTFNMINPLKEDLMQGT